MAKSSIAPLSPAAQDYLKAIYTLSARDAERDAGSVRVGTQQLADHMGLSPASVSRMLQRLAGVGLIEYEAYQGATLTPAGRGVALELVRHHRLLELYLQERLGYRWDEVHAEAELLEHYISEELEARMFESLGRPEVDPHGEPIPTLDGEVPPGQRTGQASELALADAPAGSAFQVRRVPSEDPARLRYLSDQGLVPGAEVQVLEQYPFGGGVRMQVRGRAGDVVLGRELAGLIRVAHIVERADRGEGDTRE